MNVFAADAIARASCAAGAFRWAEIGQTFASDAVAATVCREYPTDGFRLVERLTGDKQYRMWNRTLVARDGAVDDAGLTSVWQQLLAEATSADYRALVGAQLGVDLGGLEREVVLWQYGPGCWLDAHVDKPDKVATHVVYLNDAWSPELGGCLELLRTHAPETVFHRVVPAAGRSIVFLRSDSSWHQVAPVAPTAGERMRRTLQVVFWERR